MTLCQDVFQLIHEIHLSKREEPPVHRMNALGLFGRFRLWILLCADNQLSSGRKRILSRFAANSMSRYSICRIDLDTVHFTQQCHRRVSGGIPFASGIHSQISVQNSTSDRRTAQCQPHFPERVFMENIALGINVMQSDLVAKHLSAGVLRRFFHHRLPSFGRGFHSPAPC